jgi:AraC-like DNA-binding protein
MRRRSLRSPVRNPAGADHAVPDRPGNRERRAPATTPGPCSSSTTGRSATTWTATATAAAPPPPRRLARDLRDLIDAHIVTGITLDQAARTLHAHPTHLVRAFTATYGLPPRLYLTGRRIDRARGQVAGGVGFYDQAHLNRHFRRYLGTTPVRYLRDATGHRPRDPVDSPG